MAGGAGRVRSGAGQARSVSGVPAGVAVPLPGKDCANRDCPIHDTAEKTWRHMDFFQHRAFLHARLPRVWFPEHGVRQVGVPWAREGSGFTLLFEALQLQFAAAMPVRTVAGMVGEHDTRIWRVLDHHVSASRACADHSQVTRVGMDETAAARGQDYVSIFADMDRRRVLFATEGRDGDTVARFAADLSAHGGDPARVTDTSSDMSAAYIARIDEHLPNAAMTFDRFHVMAKLSETVDAVRRDEFAARPELKGTRWLWLKNRATLTDRQQGELFALTRRRGGWPPPGHCAGARTSRPSTTSPTTGPNPTCSAGATAPNAHGCNRSRTSSRPWNATGTASSPGTPAGSTTACWKGSTPSCRRPRPAPATNAI
ncbi:MAG TPA: ISL3 family transposase [Aldersonia sp.]